MQEYYCPLILGNSLFYENNNTVPRTDPFFKKDLSKLEDDNNELNNHNSELDNGNYEF